MARARRQEARAKKEEAERETRERAREQRRSEREERERRAQERKAKYVRLVVEFSLWTKPVGSVDDERRTPATSAVSSSLQPTRNPTPNGVRTPDWTLDCEVCGRCGVNMVRCPLCRM